MLNGQWSKSNGLLCDSRGNCTIMRFPYVFTVINKKKIAEQAMNSIDTNNDFQTIESYKFNIQFGLTMIKYIVDTFFKIEAKCTMSKVDYYVCKIIVSTGLSNFLEHFKRVYKDVKSPESPKVVI